MKIILSKSFRRVTVLTCSALTLWLGLAQCYGSFELTRKVYSIGEIVENKWLRQTIFLIAIVFFTVLTFASIVFDIFIFNVLEFWMGENLLADGSSKATPPMRIVHRGDVKAEFAYSAGGSRMDVSIYRKNRLAAVFTAYRDQPGRLYLDQGGRQQLLHLQSQDGMVGERYSLYAGSERLSGGIISAAIRLRADRMMSRLQKDSRNYQLAAGAASGGFY